MSRAPHSPRSRDYDLRLMVGIALVVVILGQLVLRYLPFGRRLYAIGSNPDARAHWPGFPAKRDVFLAFAICGALAGLAGFMFLVRFGNITVTAAQGLELQVVAAVVVGGVNIFGGSGSMIGALLGVLMIEILQQSLLRWAGISEFVKDAILGLLILIAITADAVILGRLREMWVRVRRRDRDRARRRLGGRTEGGPWRVSVLRRLRSWEGLLLVPAGRAGLQHHQVPNFLTMRNQINLFQLGIEKAIVILVMTFVIISGEIDLSVASMMGLSAAVAATVIRAGVPMPLAIVAGAGGRTCAWRYQRLLCRGRRSELAGGDAGGVHRLSRAGPVAGRGPLGRRIPGLVHDLGQTGLDWTDHASRS